MIYLVDASIYVFRAWFSLPDSMTDRDGRPVNALYGFGRFLSELLTSEKPARIAVAFDTSLTSSFRNELYPAYKANRPLPPPELEYQFGLCRQLTRLLGLAEFASTRFEADDIIGALAANARAAGEAVTVVSADKDLTQVLREGDVFFDAARERRLGYRDIQPAFGVRPEQIPDLLALTGDAVDNIPGVPGIGPKTAIALLGTFESLDDALANLDRLDGLKTIRGAARIARLLREHAGQARMARQLATVATHGEVLEGAEAQMLVRRRPDLPGLGEFFDALGMGEALRRRAQHLDDAMAAGGTARPARSPEADSRPALTLFRTSSAGDGPDDGWQAIADAVFEDGGPRLDPSRVTPVTGGCIHGTYRVRGDDADYFVKRNHADQAPVLRAEAQGLRALAGADVVRVPRPARCGVAGDNAYLVMEWIDLGKLERAGARQLGAAVAHLHRVRGERHGWHEDNYIGATPQANGWSGSWTDFFRDRRLLPQLELASAQGYRGSLQEAGRYLASQLGQLLDGHEPQPSLLHGDLWAGNCAADDKGRPVLFDPAVHYGDAECDLAMTALFGGFDQRFYDAYAGELPRQEGFERRRDLYQLYHVLNHLNLFGGGYLAHAERLLQALTREV